MRLLSIVILSLLPLVSAAQQFKIGISAHVLHHDGMSNDNQFFESQQGFGYGGAIAVAHSYDWVELKYAFEMGRLQGREIEVYTPLIPASFSTPTYTVFKSTGYQAIADQYYLPYVAANVKIPMFKIKPYAGVMVGVVKTNGSGKTYVDQYAWSEPVSFQPFKTYGVAAGLQAGGAYPLSRHFELTGELAYRAMWVDELRWQFFGKAHSIYYQLNAWQFNAGINYVFDWDDE